MSYTDEEKEKLNKSIDRTVKYLGFSIALLSAACLLLASTVLYTIRQNATKDKRADCFQVYTNAVTVAQSNFFISFSEGVVAVFQNHPQSELTVLAETIETDSAAYKKAVKDRNDYDEAGRPLPCTIS